jgi:hypothetical protein
VRPHSTTGYFDTVQSRIRIGSFLCLDYFVLLEYPQSLLGLSSSLRALSLLSIRCLPYITTLCFALETHENTRSRQPWPKRNGYIILVLPDVGLSIDIISPTIQPPQVNCVPISPLGRVTHSKQMHAAVPAFLFITSRKVKKVQARSINEDAGDQT